MTRFQIYYLLIFSLCTTLKSNGQNYVSTYSGNGSPGLINDTLTLAKFNYPFGLCIDKFNNLYVADGDNNCIRKINTTTAQVTTLAGTGIAGWKDGSVDSAMFNSPSDLCVDDSGNVFVSDFLNQRIRKISSSGIVSTIAGNGLAGLVDGASLSSEFNYPRGICCDKHGYLYVSDSWNHRIRKIDNSGIVSTYAGGGTATGVGSIGSLVDAVGSFARFYTPAGMVIDQTGNLYIADAYNHRIRLIDTNRTVTTFSGSGMTGQGNGGFLNGNNLSARYNTPTEVFVDTNLHVLYIGDTFNNRIRKSDLTSGIVTTFAGSGAASFSNGIDTMATFNYPRGVVSDSSGLKVYVVDYNNHSIRLIAPSGTTGIHEENSFINLSIFPNPAEREIWISEIPKSNYRGQILDLSGNIIMEFSLNRNSKQIDISDLKNGVYYVKIQYNSGKTVVGKFLKID